MINIVKDVTPNNHTCGKFTTHRTGGAPYGHGLFFFEKLWRDPFFGFFFSKKMRKSLVSYEKRVKSNDKNDKRVLSI